MSDWISTRNFSESVSFEERCKIMQLYADKKWDTAKALLGGRNRITRNGIIIAKKMKEQLDVNVFPMIFITATKGYMDAGCARFMMIGERGEDYLFGYNTKSYLPKKTILEEYNQGGLSIWIEIKQLQKPLTNPRASE